MKRSTTCLAIAAMLVLVTLASSGQTKKYDIKSCIVTFETTQKVAGMEIKNKVVLSFDDYGMKECRETYQGNKIREVYFSNGKNLYRLNPDKKTAAKLGEALLGTEGRLDWNDISSADKKAGNAKHLPNMTIAGKTCEAFVVNVAGSSTTYANWNHIMMMLDMKSKDVNTLKKAITVDEKTAVSADKFKIPAGYTIK
jgi:hypothetical protein